jgi:hypothetical protein
MSSTPPISRACRGVRWGADDLFAREEAERRAPFEEERELRVLVRRMLGPACRDGSDSTLWTVAVDPFGLAEARYKLLVEERRGGIMHPRAFRLAVRDLSVSDGEGRRWMLGPADGIWYRRESGRWLQADPPRRLVCPACSHHNLGRHSFCVECGHRLNR